MAAPLLVCTPESACDPTLAIAAVRAGEVGLLDLGLGSSESERSAALGALARRAAGSDAWGVRWDAWARGEERTPLPAPERAEDRVPILLMTGADDGADLAARVERARRHAARVFFEALDVEQARAAEAAGCDGVVLKGNEAGGRVGRPSSLLLLQALAALPRPLRIPVWIQGAWGPDTAAIVALAGAQGVVLCEELWLARESPFSLAQRACLEGLDGSETVCLDDGRTAVRLFGRALAGSARGDVADLERALGRGEDWTERLRERWRAREAPLCMGQGIAFAAGLARRHGNVRRILDAFRRTARPRLERAARRPALGPDGPLARAHGVRYPIVQGPMTRVSDGVPFCRAVAENGALPFLALALLRRDEARALLVEARERMGERPWGVGVLGFVPPELRREQLEVIREVRPRFGIIAGGRPSQAAAMEAQGIATYLHVPSPGLLRAFLEQGARKFVFEGRECGGHVGPRSSLVLWQSAIDVLGATPIDDPQNVQVLFAGGIHDALSAAMVEVAAVPLVERGMKVGVLMGTAYLFTPEAVDTGAITRRYQEEAIACGETVLLESGVGHATRCAPTPFAEEFGARKRDLLAEGLSPDEVRGRLELFNVGRLRVASKGTTRAGSPERVLVDPTSTLPESLPASKPALVAVDDATQRREGMYMIGALAALRAGRQPMAALHEHVSAGSAGVLARAAATHEGREAEGAEPIAIVGMACTFPGAPDLRAYWENVLRGESAVRDVPPERWNPELFPADGPDAADGFANRRGGFLDDVRFDPLRYGIPPASLASVEPAQLLALEIARRALDDAGYDRRPLERDRAAVILGVSGIHDLGIGYAFRTLLPHYLERVPDVGADERERIVRGLRAVLPPWTEDSFPGFLPNLMAGRIANRLDLRGANYVVDAACSSSLAAVHAGVEQLRSGTSDVVLAGAVDWSNHPFTFMSFARTHALTPGDRARPFDAGADGIVLGEGVGVVVLKRLADAERDGDTIYAVLRGIGCSSDGRNKSVTAPFTEAQVEAMRRAYEDAGVDPATVTLVEAHATGTAVGDRNEILGLGEVFGTCPGRDERPACAIGSVKSMIGHAKVAAGVAGLIKTALALDQGVLPPTIHVETPNPALEGAGALYLNTETRPWIDAAPARRAGVSAFGFGGTNFHAVLEEHVGTGGSWGRDRTAPRPGEVFAWRRADRAEMARDLRAFADAVRGVDGLRLDRLARAVHVEEAARAAPGAGGVRLALAATSTEDLGDGLARALEALERDGATLDPMGVYCSDAAPVAASEVCFLFPGQGAQYPGMLGELAWGGPFDTSFFEYVDELLADLVPGRLSDRIFPPPALDRKQEKRQREALKDTRITQPAVAAADLFAFEVLRRFGLAPSVAAGHSLGESVALTAAGSLTPNGLLRLSAKRGLALHEVASQNPGGMAAVAADEPTTRAALERLGLGVRIANTNAPRQTIVAGTEADLQAALRELRASGIAVRRVAVNGPFHTPAMQPAAANLRRELGATPMAAPAFPVYSFIDAAPYPADVEGVRDRLTDNVTACVRFVDLIEALHRDGARLFVESGPGRILTGLVSNILEGRPHHALALDRTGQPAWLSLGHLLAHAHALGVPVDLAPWFEGRGLADETVADVVESRRREAEGRPTDWILGPSGSRPVTPLARPRAEMRAETRPVASAPPRPEEPREIVSQRQEKPPMNELDPGAERPPVAPDLLRFQQETMRQWLELQREQARVQERFLRLQERLVAAQLGLPPDALPEVDAAPAAALPSAVASPMPGLPVAPAPTLPALVPTGGAASPPQASPTATSEPTAPVAASALPSAPAPKAVSESERAPDGGPPSLEAFRADLLAQVSQRTGYPEEMLDPELPLEAGLGIDSIKLMEIFSALQPYHAALTQPDEDEEDVLARFTQLKTLGAILEDYEGRRAELLERGTADAASRDEASGVEASGKEAPVPTKEILPAPRGGGVEVGGGAAVDRLVVRSVRVTSTEEVPIESGALRFSKDHVLLLVGDVPRYGVALSAALAQGGYPACQVLPGDGLRRLGERRFEADFDDPESLAGLAEAVHKETGARVGGIVSLLGLTSGFRAPDLAATDAPLRLATWLLNLAKTFEDDVRESVDAGGGLLVNLTGFDGCFGLSGARPLPVAQAASLGFFKSLAKEWRGVRVKNLDIDPDAEPEVLLSAILAELAQGDDRVEVGINTEGRWRLDLVDEPNGNGGRADATNGGDAAGPRGEHELGLDAESVVFATGGAYGITAEVLKHLVAETRARLVLVGRSAATEDEPADTAGLASAAELREALIRRAGGNGHGRTPAEIEAEVHAILKRRAIRENLAAFAQAGSAVEYHSLDVRDEAALAALVDDVYARHGRIDAVIHGAGVVEDKWLKEKTPESFERVFQTKVKPALVLARTLRPEGLRFCAFFSSVSGRFGNAGQADYSAANECLNKLAAHLDREWPGRVVALNWGPWDFGLVSDALRSAYKQRGVELISVGAGGRAFLDELSRRDARAPEVVLACNARGLARSSRGPNRSGRRPGQRPEQRSEQRSEQPGLAPSRAQEPGE